MTTTTKAPSRVGRNVAANLVGKIWLAVSNLLLVPFYVHTIGIESYGLIGFFATLQGLFPLLDLGLSTTVNRELARLDAAENVDDDASRHLVRTLEIIYWMMALVIFVTLTAAAPWIGTHWFHAQRLSPSTTSQSIAITSIALALQFPYDLYAGGLIGLQRQVKLNQIIIFTATLNAVGAVIVLKFLSPTVQAYCCWQAVVALARTSLCAGALWRHLPKSPRPPQFQKALARRLWGFAATLSGTGILTVALWQMDKIVLSKLLPLSQFGYYTLASQIATGLTTFVTPVHTAYFPVLAQFAALKDESGLRQAYHRGTQLMVVAVYPIALVIALFSYQVLYVWTGDRQTALQAHQILSFLVIGTALNGLMNIPYALQLAHGWVKLMLYYNAALVVISLPILLVLVHNYGALGAAYVWVGINASYILIAAAITHRRLLTGESAHWYLNDVGLPVAAAVIAAAATHALAGNTGSRVGQLAVVSLSFAVTLLASSLAAPELRRRLFAAAPIGAARP